MVKVDEELKKIKTDRPVDSPIGVASNEKTVHELPARYVYGLADKGVRGKNRSGSKRP